MSTIKTAVSLDSALFQEVEGILLKRHISRSKFFADAITAYIKKMQNQRLLENLNKAYADQPDRTEKKHSAYARAYHRRRVKDRW